MIDPKLNEIPVENRTAADRPASETEASERQKRGRAGLSINDTIAGDTLLSTGGRGVDTSGVSAGSGAAAGASAVTPAAASESPAPQIVPGARTSGTTPRSTANQNDLSNSVDPERLGEGINTTSGSRNPGGIQTRPGMTGHAGGTAIGATPNTLEVAQRAYEIWCAKGCPEGTADEDWWQAERELQGRSSSTMVSTAGH